MFRKKLASTKDELIRLNGIKFGSKFLFFSIIFLFAFSFTITAQINKKMPLPIEKSKDEPVKYSGSLKPDKHFYDGLLPHVVGVHHFQTMRANRSHPPERGEAAAQGWTYNHQPYLVSVRKRGLHLKIPSRNQ